MMVDEKPMSDGDEKANIANEFVFLARIFLEKLRLPKQDIEKNAKALFAETVSKMDLVTRDELERQQILLAQAQAQLVHMQEKIEQLEKAFDAKSS